MPGTARVVALVATPGAVSSGWPGEVAKALAGAWASRGSRVVLADAGLAVPTLHEAFGMDNEEGLADVLLRGAPVRRATRPVPRDGFYLISGGTPTAGGARAFAGGRWGRFRARFREAGLTIVAFVPEGEPGWASVVSTATDVLILAEPSDDLTDARNAAGDRVRAVVGWGSHEGAAPSGGEDAAPVGLPEPAPAGKGEDGGDRARDEEARIDPLHVIGGASADRVLLPPPVVDVEATADGAAVDGGRTRRPDRPKSGGSGWPIAGVGIAVVAIGAILLGRDHFPPSDVRPGGEAAPAAVPDPPAGPSPATPTLVKEEPLMGFSVALGSYRNGQSAARRARVVGRRVPGILVLVVPVEIDGALYHRVLAGPVRDSVDASRLAAEIDRQGGLDSSGWVLRATPRAFRLDETGELAAARERSDALSASGVPAYVLAVPDADGSMRYRVYAGAYADEAEASYLAGLLRERGITTATLSDRTGRLPE